MYKKIKALTWLRTQILLTNSSLLMSVLLPFGLLFLYNMILNKNGNAGQGLLKMILPMTCYEWRLYGVYYDGRGQGEAQSKDLDVERGSFY